MEHKQAKKLSPWLSEWTQKDEDEFITELKTVPVDAIARSYRLRTGSTHPYLGRMALGLMSIGYSKEEIIHGTGLTDSDLDEITPEDAEIPDDD